MKKTGACTFVYDHFPRNIP